MKAAGIAGVALFGPGLGGWDESHAILTGERPYAAEPMERRFPDIIPPRERRRTSPSVGLALLAADSAARAAGADVEILPAVFGSSIGEGQVTHRLLESVTGPQPFASPTLFHNSVHNTAAGYWSIAVGTHAPCSSIAAFDYTFGAALMKGLVQAAAEDRAVLVVVFDEPLPPPLHDCRPLTGPFAVALVVAPEVQPGHLAALGLSHGRASGAVPSEPGDAGLKALWRGNPAARSLPLLQLIASGGSGTVILEERKGSAIRLEVRPCST